MLTNLSIRDMLIIDQLELVFAQGLTVLTGETGAGKSILLDSLGFVLGWRGRADLVRSGAEQGEVIAVFELTEGHPVLDVLREAGIRDGLNLIIRRVNGKDGRKTGWINDRRVSGDLLRTVAQHLVELHGQHDDRGLLDSKGHRHLLDQFGGHIELIESTRRAWNEVTAAQNDLIKETEMFEALRHEEEYLRHAVEELNALNPLPGEEAELDGQRRLMQSAEKMRVDIDKAVHALGREAAEGMLMDALRWLEAAGNHLDGKLDDAIESLSLSMSNLNEALQYIKTCLEELDFNPIDLETTEERLFAIRRIGRKHKVSADALTELAQYLTARLSALDAGENSLAVKQMVLQRAQDVYYDAANSLSQARKASAEKLDRRMMSELVPLKMDRAIFQTDVTPSEAGPHGNDKIVFSVTTNPGLPPGPLSRIASGGELSRFLLALKVCLRTAKDFKTVIFDEIDRGVGGATADAVGRRLSELSVDAQVLVVTHSPQVAGFATRHFRVSKQLSENETQSDVENLDQEARVEEIARMISGDIITKEALAAAGKLIKTSS
ncbi:MAG: DNA repair protein RecN [Aestuariivita sp.]|nr:DNA repair protein RecN [Aestuariivita sp.]